MRKSILLMVLAAVFGTQQMTAFAADESATGVPYLSGGIGEAELEQIRQVRGDFNLRLLFAERTGAYITGVRVVIADDKGKTILDLKNTGPYLFARLPVGRYQIKATYEGQRNEQRVALGANSAQEAVFRW